MTKNPEEDKVVLISRALLFNQVIGAQELSKQAGTEELAPYIEECRKRFRQVGADVLALTDPETQKASVVSYALVLSNHEPNLSAEYLGVLAAVSAILKMKGGAAPTWEINHMFQATRSTISRLVDQGLLSRSEENYRLTLRGRIVLNDAFDHLEDLVSEFLNL